MNYIIVITHSNLAEGFKNCVDFLTGKGNAIKFVNAYQDKENWFEKAENYLRFTEFKGKKIVLTDIYGGSVNQKMASLKSKYNFFLISGINLPLLLALVLEEKEITLKKCKELVVEAQHQIKIVELDNNGSTCSNSEEDFLS